MTWVKFCGTTNLRDARAGIAAGADALGFIFAPSLRQIEVTAAAEIIAELPDEIDKIGVFVNEMPARVAEVADRAGLTGVQLHGTESADELRSFRQALGRRKIIKALQASELTSTPDGIVPVWLRASDVIDAILLDSGSPTRPGGTGMPFDWEAAVPLARAIQTEMPLIIAGGLTAENVGIVLRLFSPWGVDVVSGVERELGRKDDTKLRDFVVAVRELQPAQK